MLICLNTVAPQSADERETMERCIARLANGDAAAMEPLYNIANAAVYAFALSMLKNRHNAEEAAQKAADLSYDGLFMESHVRPDEALSDAAQQVTPEQLGELLAGIRWRRETVDVPQVEADMERLRLEIDQIDAQLFALLSRRMGIAEDIGRIKRENDVIILQRRRWDDIVDNMVARAG